MYRSYFLTCHEFHQPKFELALQGHCISLPETMIKGLRKLLCTCQRHPNSIAVGSLIPHSLQQGPQPLHELLGTGCCPRASQEWAGSPHTASSYTSWVREVLRAERISKQLQELLPLWRKTKQNNTKITTTKKIHKQNSLYFAETLKKLKTSCL